MTLTYYLKILSIKEKKKIVEKLNKQFGIKKIPGIILQRGKERMFLFQGDFSVQEIKKLEQIIQIERVGIYFAKLQNDEVRLSIDAIHLLKNQITKNIFELNQEQMEQWMHGNELNIKTRKNCFVVMKYKDYFLGTGKASEEKITNFIPKNRRLKNKN